MPHFTKQISQPGKKLASTPDGKRVWVELTKERQQGWVDQFYRLKAKGLRIPAPYVHRNDSAGQPLTQEELKKISSKDNAGFWEDFWVDQNNNLMGRLNVPLLEDARKISKTILDVSPAFKPNYTDGDGITTQQETLMHVALVTHPVDQNSPNFQPILNEEGAQMSLGFALIPLGGFQMDTDDAASQGGNELSKVPSQTPENVASTPSVPAGGDFSAAVQILQKIGLNLPPDTNPANLVERIVSTGGQMIIDKEKNVESDESLIKPPEGASSQPAPVALAHANKMLVSIATIASKNQMITRINNLVTTGRVPHEFAEKNFIPQVNAFQLSLDPSGNPLASPLEMTLTTLEAMPSPVAPITGLIPGAEIVQFGAGAEGKFQVQEPPKQGGEQLSGKELEEAVKEQLADAGLEPVQAWTN